LLVPVATCADYFGIISGLRQARRAGIVLQTQYTNKLIEETLPRQWSGHHPTCFANSVSPEKVPSAEKMNF
jgi:hypothetical protein